MELEDVRADLQAFADDEDDVAVDAAGTLMVVRGGHVITASLVDRDEGIWVRVAEDEIPYRRFLTHHLARLDVFAERLLARRQSVPAFVDGPARVNRPVEEPREGHALELLLAECQDAPPFAARVSFITADAGYGKTALLREQQWRQAQAFQAGRSSYLFWHVDLQGRQLLRLSEALMGDLGDLRISGLWMSAIIKLIRERALILAIDGFDELAAEQGGTDALGALATLVSQLEGKGTVIAAARRTFFDTEDYLRRAGLFQRALGSPCQFDQLALRRWGRTEGIAYLSGAEADSKTFPDPEQTYEDIASALGDVDGHPMVATPFLLTQVARALLRYGISAEEFLRAADDPMSGVAAVVEAFVHREVSEKWVYRDTAEPYLTVEQHMELLADVAEEMYRSQKDRLEVDVIETIATLLLDKWNVEAGRRQQVLEMVRMHVLLVPPDSDSRVRAFDHPEFRDYFIAFALRSHIERVMQGADATELSRYLSIAQLSDATARYVCAMLDRTEDRVRTLLQSLEKGVATEWRPTFLQVNVGTLVPYVLNGLEPADDIAFSAPVIYSSVVFEKTKLTRVRLSGGTFVNASLMGVTWRGVTLEQCDLSELLTDTSSRFDNVTFRDCRLEGVRHEDEDGDEVREYAPTRVEQFLTQMGIHVVATQQPEAVSDRQPSDEPRSLRVLRRLLRVFYRTTVVSDQQLNHRFRQDQQLIFDDIIPLLVRHEVLVEQAWRGAGSARIWVIKRRIDDVLAAETDPRLDATLAEMWRDAKAMG